MAEGPQGYPLPIIARLRSVDLGVWGQGWSLGPRRSGGGL